MFPSTHQIDSLFGAPGRRSRRRAAIAILAVGLTATVLAGCTDDTDPVAVSSDDQTASASCLPKSVPEAVKHDDASKADVDGTTLTLATHDSFATSDGIFDSFTKATGVTVEVVTVGDAGVLVSQSILTAGKPVADVLFGIDTTFLCRGTRAGLFVPYESPTLSDVDDGYELADGHLATPIDVGDVCLNYSKTAYPDVADAPQGLDDLIDPRFADQFVTENPESSSPGLAFLLATIAEYGDDGWEDYWTDLRANGAEVTSGWTEAYEDAFGAGSGDRSIVTSYASSPVADVLYDDPP
ncbi:MAG: thiamine ABC transporter substrate-binding protein, partial [Aquihabitans sp.]